LNLRLFFLLSIPEVSDIFSPLRPVKNEYTWCRSLLQLYHRELTWKILRTKRM
jgi:hypothetical protein